MKKPLLVFGAWGLAFVVALIVLIIAGPSHPRFTGTVVLDFKPFCQNFVVQTERGFVIFMWEDGTLFLGKVTHLWGLSTQKGFSLSRSWDGVRW